MASKPMASTTSTAPGPAAAAEAAADPAETGSVNPGVNNPPNGLAQQPHPFGVEDAPKPQAPKPQAGISASFSPGDVVAPPSGNNINSPLGNNDGATSPPAADSSKGALAQKLAVAKAKPVRRMSVMDQMREKQAAQNAARLGNTTASGAGVSAANTMSSEFGSPEAAGSTRARRASFGGGPTSAPVTVVTAAQGHGQKGQHGQHGQKNPPGRTGSAGATTSSDTEVLLVSVKNPGGPGGGGPGGSGSAQLLKPSSSALGRSPQRSASSMAPRSVNLNDIFSNNKIPGQDAKADAKKRQERLAAVQAKVEEEEREQAEIARALQKIDAQENSQQEDFGSIQPMGSGEGSEGSLII